ncbi:MAG: hypothetical protein EOO04_03950 [Chitinophagaceae bacterium]|nr:MAG: hypothetical protein EOO04_03950 [Chitinophagaceae bacterium]
MNIFNTEAKTIVLNKIKNQDSGNLKFVRTDEANKENTGCDGDIFSIVKVLYDLQITSVIVEGGSQLIGSFIEAGCWDEARVITNPHLLAFGGTAAPLLKSGLLTDTMNTSGDIIQYFINQETKV